MHIKDTRLGYHGTHVDLSASDKASLMVLNQRLVLIGIPVMRYDRAARPCALNFCLAALKCRFGRPPNALSSVGV